MSISMNVGLAAVAAVAQAAALLALTGCGGGIVAHNTATAMVDAHDVSHASTVAPAAPAATPAVPADPAPVALRWLADEGASFTVDKPTVVRIIPNGNPSAPIVEKLVAAGGECTNDFFGYNKALPGLRQCVEVVGSAAPAPATARWLADQGSHFTVTQPTVVRIVPNGNPTAPVVERTVTGSGDCTNDFFDYDKKVPGFRQCVAIVYGAAPAAASAPPRAAAAKPGPAAL